MWELGYLGIGKREIGIVGCGEGLDGDVVFEATFLLMEGRFA